MADRRRRARKAYSIAEVQAQFASLARKAGEVDRTHELAETLEILASADARKAIALDRAGKGRYFDLDDLDL